MIDVVEAFSQSVTLVRTREATARRLDATGDCSIGHVAELAGKFFDLDTAVDMSGDGLEKETTLHRYLGWLQGMATGRGLVSVGEWRALNRGDDDAPVAMSPG